MMTREHVDELCNALVQNGNIVKARLFSEHDAEQRAEIERLTHTIRELLARFGEQNYPEVQAAQQVMKEHP